MSKSCWIYHTLSTKYTHIGPTQVARCCSRVTQCIFTWPFATVFTKLHKNFTLAVSGIFNSFWKLVRYNTKGHQLKKDKLYFMQSVIVYERIKWPDSNMTYEQFLLAVNMSRMKKLSNSLKFTKWKFFTERLHSWIEKLHGALWLLKTSFWQVVYLNQPIW